MSLAAIPTTLFLSREKITLGVFTTNLAAVHEDYWAPKVDSVPPAIEEEFDFMSLENNSAQTKFSAALSSLISARLFGKSACSCVITPGRGKWYLLENVTAWFQNAMKSDEMKLWVQEQAASDENIYLIIGIQTLIDPRIEIDFTGRKQGEAAMRLPDNLLPDFQIISPAVEGGGDRETSNKLGFAASGERIFALRYRKITFKWLKHLSSKPTKLSRSCTWTCLDTPWRGANGQNDDASDTSDRDMSYNEEDDVIEVTVGTDSTLPDEDWAEERTENGHYCISTIAEPSSDAGFH